MLIAMVTYDTIENKRAGLTQQTIHSLMSTVNTLRHRIIIVDNGSTEPGAIYDLKAMEGMPGFTVIWNGENIGTARAINRAWQRRRPGEHCIKMDNDVVVYQKDWVDVMEEVFARSPQYGIVGLKRKDLEQRPGHSASFFRSKLVMLPHKKGERWIVVEAAEDDRNVLDIMGTCTAYSSKLLDKIGYLYQGSMLYGYDDNLSVHRCQMVGLRTCFLPTVEIDHVDPGGTEWTQWKRDYAIGNSAEYQRIVREFRSGLRSVYCAPDEP